MLNRRTKSQVGQNYDDCLGDDEREALLSTASGFTSSTQNNYRFTNHLHHQASSSAQPPGGQQNVIGYTSAQPLQFNQPQLPLPIQRRARDRSPTLQNNLLIGNNCRSDHLSSSSFASIPSTHQLQHNYGGESYELGPSNANYSRAISIHNSNDSSYSRNSTTDFIYYIVQPGDTLQNLSVKYSCPVASIKRLNNLWSDQEFYGLTRLKLPVGKLRLIADVIDEDVTAKQNFPYDNTDDNNQTSLQQQGSIKPNLNISRSTKTEVHHSHVQNTFLHHDINEDEFNLNPDDNLGDNKISSSGNESIFKDYDLNIEKARSAARSYKDNASAIMQTLAQSGNIVAEDFDDPNKLAQREAEILLNDLSDYGLSYNGLILFIFIVCLIFPLAYVIYLEETHHDSNKAP